MFACRELTKQEIKAIRGLLSCINGALYFFIAALGTFSFVKAIHQDSSSSSGQAAIITLGIGSSLCYTMFCYMTLKGLILKPEGPVAYSLVALAPLAASPFFIAGRDGSQLFSIQEEGAITIGLILFLLRNINMVDGSVKLPKRMEKLWNEWRRCLSKPRENKANMARIVVALYTALGYSASATDAIYAAIYFVLSLLTKNTNVLVPLSYTGSVLGATATFPMVLHWCNLGSSLIIGGEQFETGSNPINPRDLYTIYGGIGSLSIIPGNLGGVTEASGQVFARLGTAAIVIRASTSVLYSIFAAMPGLAVLFRGLKCSGGEPTSRSATQICCYERGLFRRPVTKPDSEEQLLLTDVEGENVDGLRVVRK